MATTDDYLKAIKEKRDKGETAKVDFSQLPADVDSGKIANALSDGLPNEYGKAIQDRLKNKTPISLNYGIIHVKQSVPDKVWDTIKDPVMGALKQVTSPKEIAKAAQTPIPPLQRFGEKADTALSKGVEKFSPTEDEITAKAQKTGSVPYGKIAERTAAQTGAKFMSGLVPRTPLDVAMYAAPMGMGGKEGLETAESAAKMLSEGKTIGQIAKELGVPEDAARKAIDSVQGAKPISRGVPEQEGAATSPGASSPAPQGQQSIGQTPLPQTGISPESVANQGIFQGPKYPSVPSVTGHPEYVKIADDAAEVVKRYAKARGIEATPEFSQKLFHELHDAFGDVRMAKPEERMAVMKRVMQEHPSIENDFKALNQKIILDTAGDQIEEYFPTFLKRMGIGEHPTPAEPIDTTNGETVAKALQGEPNSLVKAMKQAYEKFMANHRELVNNVGEIVGYQLNPSEASSTAHNLFDRRFGDIGLGHFESQLFVRDATRNLNPIEKQAIPFVIEGEIPQADRFTHPQAKEILAAAQNPTDAMKLAVAKIGPYLKEGHSFLKDVFEDIGFHDNYITHIWDRPEGLFGPGKQSLSKYNPFTKSRFIGSYAEGINMGMNPKTLDIGEILAHYDNYKIRSVANAKFAEQLKNLDVLKTPETAPPDWVRLNDPKYRTLQRKMLIPGEKKGDPGLLMFRPMAVHPDYLPAIDAIVTKPFSNDAIRGMELFNAAYKKSLFSFSLFHHFTLSTIDMAAGGNPLKVVGQTIAKRFLEAGETNPFKYLLGEQGALNRKNLYKSFMEGHAAFDNIPVARDAIEHGLNVNPLSDAQVGRIRNAMVKLEERVKNTPIVGQVAKAATTYDKVFDKGLWDYLHAGVKMDLYQRHLEQNIKAFPDMPIEQIKRQTAEFVNNAAGGALDGMMLSPRFQQTLHWAMIAPDFFLTRLNTFASMFKQGPVGFQARKMWLKAAVAYYGTANTINYVNTQKAYGKGQFMWENDADHQLTPFLNRVDKGPQKGRQQFLKLDKALTEPIEFLMHPKKVLGNKFSPYANAIAVYWTGHTMSGYKPQDEGPMDYLKQSIPMSLRGQSIGGIFPKISGMGKQEIATQYAKAFDAKDKKKMEELAHIAKQNGYNPTYMRRQVEFILRQEKRKQEAAR